MGDVTVLKKEDFDAVVTEIQNRINATKPDMSGFARLSDIEDAVRKTTAAVKVEAKIDGKPVDAELEEVKALSGFTNMKVFDIPIGKAIAGGAIAILASELVDGLMTKYSVNVKGISKLVVAGVTVKFLSKPLGKELAGAVAFLLAFDAARDLTPIDQWMNKAANKVSGVIPTGGLGDQRGGGAALKQANKVMKDYYSKAEGRR
jgi:hypothetical protein